MKFKISLIYIVFLIFSYFIYGPYILLALIISFLLHEVGHIVTLLCLKVKITELSFNIFGGKLNIEGVNRSPIEDVIIYLSGPLINLILLIIGIFFKNEPLIIVNKYLLIFNLLPCLPLDGFYIILNFNSLVLPFYKAYIISLIVSLIFSIGLLFLGIFLNVYILILGVYFLYLSILNLKNKDLYNEIILDRISKSNLCMKNKKVKESIKLKEIIYKGRRTYFIINNKVYTDDFFLKKHLKKT